MAQNKYEITIEKNKYLSWRGFEPVATPPHFEQGMFYPLITNTNQSSDDLIVWLEKIMQSQMFNFVICEQYAICMMTSFYY